MKKSKFIRCTAFILATILLLGLIGCNKTEDPQSTENRTDSPSFIETKETEPFPTTRLFHDHGPCGICNIDFEGETVSVLAADTFSIKREWGKESSEDEIDESVAIRNREVSETLNIVMNVEFIPYTDNYATVFTDKIKNDVDSGLHEYDVSANIASLSSSAIIRGYAANLGNVEIFPYFDFDLPCWNRSIVKNTIVDRQLYYIVGDINLSVYDATAVIWHNHDLYREIREPYDPEYFQQTVLFDEQRTPVWTVWSYDELYKWSTRAYSDQNLTVFAADTSQTTIANALIYSSELDIVVEIDDGIHQFYLNEHTKSGEFIQKVRSILSSSRSCADATAIDFANGNLLFYMSELCPDKDGNIAIREMDGIPCILPIPEYDPDRIYQTSSNIDRHSITFALDHSKSEIRTKGEATSALLELLTEETYVSVRGYYFNRIIKPKVFGASDGVNAHTITQSYSMQIFDMIIDGITFDYCNVYSSQFNDLHYLWKNVFLPDSELTLEDVYNEKAEEYDQALKELDIWFGLITN